MRESDESLQKQVMGVNFIGTYEPYQMSCHSSKWSKTYHRVKGYVACLASFWERV